MESSWLRLLWKRGAQQLPRTKALQHGLLPFQDVQLHGEPEDPIPVPSLQRFQPRQPRAAKWMRGLQRSRQNHGPDRGSDDAPIAVRFEGQFLNKDEDTLPPPTGSLTGSPFLF